MRFSRSIAWIYVGMFCVAAITMTALTLRWPLRGDASLMHYVVFLTRSGEMPYRDIVELNLPGTYWLEALAISLGGYGAVAWRLFDLGCCLLVALSMAVLIWPVQRYAGLFSGMLFMALHVADGIAEAGQRDLVMTALLISAAAGISLFVESGQRRWLWWSALAGGYALTIKPTALLFLLGFAWVLGQEHRRGRRLSGSLQMLLICLMSLPCVIVLVSLWSDGALPAFMWTMTRLVPFHNSLGRVSEKELFFHLVPSRLVPLAVVVCLAAWINVRGRKWSRRVEWRLLVNGLACGLLSLVIQGKLLPYHRYPSEAFFLGLMGYVLAVCARNIRSLPGRVPFAVMILLGVITTVRLIDKATHYTAPNDDLSAMLRTDLGAYGTNTLQRHVQCIDYNAGCGRTLEEMKVVQSTPFLYDCYLFQDPKQSFVQEYRRRFSAALEKNLPRILVITNEDCYRTDSFDKIGRWPYLRDLLSRRYRLVKEVHPTDKIRWASTVVADRAYRIYLQHP